MFQRSMPTARIMQSMATSEPTEISMPPVSITQVIPQVMQSRPALLIRMFKKRLQMCETLIGINHTAHGIHHKK